MLVILAIPANSCVCFLRHSPLSKESGERERERERERKRRERARRERERDERARESERDKGTLSPKAPGVSILPRLTMQTLHARQLSCRIYTNSQHHHAADLEEGRGGGGESLINDLMKNLSVRAQKSQHLSL